VTRAADVRGRRPLRIFLSSVDIRPCSGVQHDVRHGERRRRKREVPLRAGERDDILSCELLLQRAAELPAGARDQEVRSRSDRIGDFVLQSSTTRGSSHGT
jgi:hypothetical protein